MFSKIEFPSCHASMIVSSTAKVAPTYSKEGVELKNTPLIGVINDMRAFMKIYGDSSQIIETSR